MTERYDMAAERHQRVGARLEQLGETDDAAYHYGLVGENALKHALRHSGVEAAWTTAGLTRYNTPMGKHFPKLTSEFAGFSSDITLYATGPTGAKLASLINDPSFMDHFSHWSIDIRYADDQHTPVAPQICRQWGDDADDFLLKLVMMV